MSLLKRSPATRQLNSSSADFGDAELLHVRLRKNHHSTSVSDFQLETEFRVNVGVTVMVGHSGAGKTTILRCIAGLSKPDEGFIVAGNRLLFDSRQRINIDVAQRRVGLVFQDLALFPHLSVYDNVTYGLRRLDKSERRHRADEVLKAFQIEHLCRRLPREISGGEQQRVALARSLVTEPSVLLLDEPLSSLDPRTKAAIIEDLRAWNNARRIPIIYVTHDYEEVLAMGDNVIALEQGRIVAEGPPHEIVPSLRQEHLAQPANFENLFDATVIEHREQYRTMICQIIGTAIQLETPLAPVPVGSEVRIGIRADEILMFASQPKVVGACNVIPAKWKRFERQGNIIEARVSCGGEFRLRFTEAAVESFEQRDAAEIWMIIRAQACHFVRPDSSIKLRRLFVFVCSGNTSRSPMAQAICNAEIARRLRVPMEALDRWGIKAVSAGLKAQPGEPLTAEAGQTLAAMGIPNVEHRSLNLTRRMAQQAEIIFCMTEDQRNEVIALFPDTAAKTYCLKPLGNINDPTGKGTTAFSELAELLRRLVSEHLDNLGIVNAA